MTIESKIEELTKAVVSLTEAIKSSEEAPVKSEEKSKTTKAKVQEKPKATKTKAKAKKEPEPEVDEDDFDDEDDSSENNYTPQDIKRFVRSNNIEKETVRTMIKDLGEESLADLTQDQLNTLMEQLEELE